MTIAIKITNDDSREDAIVVASTLHKVNKSLLPKHSKVGTVLKGGESTVLYVHDQQSILVEEIQNG